MGIEHPKYKVAVVQAAPAWLDLDASIEGRQQVAFAPVPAYFARLHPVSPAALMGAASSAIGPAPVSVNVPLAGRVSKFWV